MDSKVDLTIGNKFQERFSFSRFKGTCENLRKTDNFNSFWFKRSELLPWNKKRYEKSSNVPLRYYRDDELSQYLNVMVRLTEDNTILYFGDHVPTDELVREELWMEAVGNIPYLATNICGTCGKLSISSCKNSFRFRECKNHNKLPRKWLVDL